MQNFRKKGAEIPVHAVDVEVIDHGGGTDQPRICGSGLLIAPALGAEHRGLLLRLADEQYTLFGGELFPVRGGHIILALSLLEMHDRYVRLFGKLIHPGDERLEMGSIKTLEAN